MKRFCRLGQHPSQLGSTDGQRSQLVNTVDSTTRLMLGKLGESLGKEAGQTNQERRKSIIQMQGDR
ncbi:hypothetical protein Hdeb2414_s0011g00374721 [Helianthus debilis subsp. tardiflorus]